MTIYQPTVDGNTVRYHDQHNNFLGELLIGEDKSITVVSDTGNYFGEDGVLAVYLEGMDLPATDVKQVGKNKYMPVYAQDGVNVKTINLTDGSSIAAYRVEFRHNHVLYTDAQDVEHTIPNDDVENVRPRGIDFNHDFDA